jgi:hypothetical protein
MFDRSSRGRPASGGRWSVKIIRMAWHAPGVVWDLYHIFRQADPSGWRPSRWRSLCDAIACERAAWRMAWEAR